MVVAMAAARLRIKKPCTNSQGRAFMNSPVALPGTPDECYLCFLFRRYAFNTDILPDQEGQGNHKENQRAEFVTQVCWISGLEDEEGQELHDQSSGSEQDRDDRARKFVFAGQVPGDGAKGKQEKHSLIKLMGQLIFGEELREKGKATDCDNSCAHQIIASIDRIANSHVSTSLYV